MSNTFDKSIATMTVRSMGFFWFNPVLMWSVICCRAVAVDLPFLNPCWCSYSTMDSWMGASMML